MSRQSMRDLLGDLDANGSAPDGRNGQQSGQQATPAEPTEPGNDAEQSPRPPAGTQSAELTESRATEVPKYRTLDRKELLARPDQIEELTTLRRRLNRKRAAHEGERITENTLIRVAIDLLLSRWDVLEGTNEDELRESVTRRLRGEDER